MIKDCQYETPIIKSVIKSESLTGAMFLSLSSWAHCRDISWCMLMWSLTHTDTAVTLRLSCTRETAEDEYFHPIWTENASADWASFSGCSSLLKLSALTAPPITTKTPTRWWLRRMPPHTSMTRHIAVLRFVLSRDSQQWWHHYDNAKSKGRDSAQRPEDMTPWLTVWDMLLAGETFSIYSLKHTRFTFGGARLALKNAETKSHQELAVYAYLCFGISYLCRAFLLLGDINSLKSYCCSSLDISQEEHPT